MFNKHIEVLQQMADGLRSTIKNQSNGDWLSEIINEKLQEELSALESAIEVMQADVKRYENAIEITDKLNKPVYDYTAAE